MISLRLHGDHQAANATVALATIDLLADRGFSFTVEAVREGFYLTQWPGRLEVFPTTPPSLLDCAHNVASAQALVGAFKYTLALPRHRVLLFAVSSDKDVVGILRVLAPHFAHFYLTRYGNNPRAVAPEELAKLMPPGPGRSIYATPADAWAAACADATPETLVVITGSVFLAGELRPLLLEAARGA